MPYLVDSGLPVETGTLAAARRDLPREYGLTTVHEKGHKSVLARVPRAKPDYNYELALVALYTTLDDLKDAKNVLLIGDEKTVRMEPLRLRDHVREQLREDKDVASNLRDTLPRDYGWTTIVSPNNHNHKALAIRLPISAMAECAETTLLYARAALNGELPQVLAATQYVYLITDDDFARIGRRIFTENVATDIDLHNDESATANPLHLKHQTPGSTLQPLE